MSIGTYTKALSGSSTTVLGLHRAADIVAMLTPPGASEPGEITTQGGKKADQPWYKSELFSKLSTFAPGAVGAAAGAVKWKEHRLLGAVVGHALVNSGYDFYKGEQRKAICNLAVEGAAVAGALYYKKNPLVGFVGGLIAGAAATYLIPGSPIKDQLAMVKSRF